MNDAMSIRRLLDEGRVVVGMEADTYSEALAQLLDRLQATGAVGDRGALDSLLKDEAHRAEPPALGRHALLSHFRTDAVTDLAVAAATTQRTFAFAPPKAPKARILILILAPRTAAKYYLKTLAGFSRLLRDKKTVEALLAASSPEKVLSVIAARDVVIRPELLVSDLMSRDVHSVSSETPLSETLHLMVRHRRRGVPVLSDNGEVLGMITEREVLQHFLPQALSAASLEGEEPQITDVEVRDVMQRTVMCLSEDQLISDVLATMITESVAQFPVVRKGKLVGFLSRSDIIEKLLEHTV